MPGFIRSPLASFLARRRTPTARAIYDKFGGSSPILGQAEAQARALEEALANEHASGLWPGKVVPEVAPAGDSWLAEPEHQDYLKRCPSGYTCHFFRPEWKLPVRNAA